MIKLVEFPKIDKRWKYGLAAVSVFAFILIIVSVQLSGKSSELEADVAEKELKTQTLSHELEDSKSATLDLAKSKSELQSELYKLKNENTELKQEVSTIKKQKAKIEKDTKDLQSRIEELEGVNSGSNTSIVKQEKRIQSLKKDISTVRDENRRLQRRIEKINGASFSLGISSGNINNYKGSYTKKGRFKF